MILDVSGMILDVSIQSVFGGSVFGDSFYAFYTCIWNLIVLSYLFKSYAFLPGRKNGITLIVQRRNL